MTAVRVLVRGTVQGVGFRWFTQDAAATQQVTGWVRNRRDGTVEAELHGERSAVDAVIASLRVGPQHARVDDVTEFPSEAHDAAPDRFEIRDTL